MKSVIYNRYGNEDTLEIAELPMPRPQNKELVIRVKAISLNPRDTSARNGDYKLFMNRKFPKQTGADFAGIVTTVGKDIKNFKVGDEVFGYEPSLNKGTASEYITIAESFIAHKPKIVSFEEASVLGCVYLCALQSIRDKCQIKPGDKVAVFGASGGVGTAAIQLAKYYGAEVTAVARSSSEEFCKEQGADYFISYDKNDIFASEKKYDVFFQVFGKNNAYYSKAKKILQPDGIFICLIPLPKYILKMLFARPAFKFTLVKSKSEDLAFISKLADQKVIKPIISKNYDLPDIKEAHKALTNGSVNGKLVVSIQ
ncbi:NAD(P)-dependent alcohol dehydrogenase [Fluviicola sp.]|uniref:NAD(P)-dependent alcohol dehydrogenase n=1 Tax=Fluviicola sp. TaxID=1917219 RepID=UPI0031E06DB3